MRKVERRATICLLLAGVLLAGMLVYAYRYVVHGKTWASFYGNQQIYTNGELNRGTIYDRYGTKLLDCTKKGMTYSSDEELRRATVHVVGDASGNVADGAINMWSGDLIGYDLLNGTYDTSAEGKSITLTIDAEANRKAYESLSNYSAGTVGVYNYKTGEIYCLVSTPSFDPENPPSSSTSSADEGSIYFNNFLQGAMTPGSTFKLVTSAAAIDTLSESDLNSFSFTCDGTNKFGSDDITCTSAHGTVDFERALAVSCNGAFGALSRKVGATALSEETTKVGLRKSLDINGIKTQKGSFRFPDDNEVNLSWAGIGQYDDQVNPCSMMVYVGSIANGGKAVSPVLLKSSSFLHSGKGESLGDYLDSSTAKKLKSMMKNNVEVTYGTYNYPGLDIYAKSGTAETKSGEDAWFVGFINDNNYPLAFVVWVKNGGTGFQTAGPIARDVLNEIISNNGEDVQSSQG